MRIGVIGRADPTGLGAMTIDFAAEMPVEKAIIMARGDRGDSDVTKVRTKGQKLVASEIDGQCIAWLLDGIDVLVGFETFYSHDVIPMAVRAGVKTVNFPMWECSSDQMGVCDHVFCTSDKDFAIYTPTGSAHRVRWPIRRDFFQRPEWDHENPSPFTVLHFEGGLNDRNNTAATMQAIDSINESVAQYQIPFLVSWGKHPPIDSRQERQNIYARGNWFLHLQAFDGLSLPQLEASALRIPVIVLDIPGFQDYPEQMRVRPGDQETHLIKHNQVIYNRPDPDHLKQVLVELMTGIREPEPGPEPATWDEFRAEWAEIVGPIPTD